MWMGKCAVKQGFFVLRDCESPALNACGFCARPTCTTHGLRRGQTFVCLDCNARQQQLTQEEQFEQMTDDDNNNTSRSGLYTYRHGYYTSQNYSPFYTGLYYDHYYDTYDTRAFDRRETTGFDEDDERLSGGFLDS
ncbi:MAG: hypothetical protein HY231_15200 [Acidobacteria bacterium]|nr:hypothetical protein [Acidobacteriota bacterium]